MPSPHLTGEQKGWHDHATRLKRALLNEKRRFGQIDDGYGKRFLIGPLYFIAGETEKALDFYRWYEQEFPGEAGDPVHCLFWALSLHKTGEIKKANAQLLETMVQNVYLLPALLGSPPASYDIWHCSNRAAPDYMALMPEERLPRLSQAERSWITGQLESPIFQRVLEEYVSTYHALKFEKDIERRREILRRWDEFLSSSTSPDH